MSSIDGRPTGQAHIGKNSVLKVKTLLLNSDADLPNDINNKGELRYNKVNNIIEYNNGENWKPVAVENKLVTIYGTFSPLRLEWQENPIYGAGAYNIVDATNTNMPDASKVKVYTTNWSDYQIYFLFEDILAESISSASLTVTYGYTEKRHLTVEIDPPVLNTGFPIQFAMYTWNGDSYQTGDYYKEGNQTMHFTLNYTKV